MSAFLLLDNRLHLCQCELIKKENNEKWGLIMSVILAGLVGAIIAAVITVHHQNIKERFLLMKK